MKQVTEQQLKDIKIAMVNDRLLEMKVIVQHYQEEIQAQESQGEDFLPNTLDEFLQAHAHNLDCLESLIAEPIYEWIEVESGDVVTTGVEKDMLEYLKEDLWCEIAYISEYRDDLSKLSSYAEDLQEVENLLFQFDLEDFNDMITEHGYERGEAL